MVNYTYYRWKGETSSDWETAGNWEVWDSGWTPASHYPNDDEHDEFAVVIIPKRDYYVVANQELIVAQLYVGYNSDDPASSIDEDPNVSQGDTILHFSSAGQTTLTNYANGSGYVSGVEVKLYAKGTISESTSAYRMQIYLSDANTDVYTEFKKANIDTVLLARLSGGVGSLYIKTTDENYFKGFDIGDNFEEIEIVLIGTYCKIPYFNLTETGGNAKITIKTIAVYYYNNLYIDDANDNFLNSINKIDVFNTSLYIGHSTSVSSINLDYARIVRSSVVVEGSTYINLVSNNEGANHIIDSYILPYVGYTYSTDGKFADPFFLSSYFGKIVPPESDGTYNSVYNEVDTMYYRGTFRTYSRKLNGITRYEHKNRLDDWNRYPPEHRRISVSRFVNPLLDSRLIYNDDTYWHHREYTKGFRTINGKTVMSFHPDIDGYYIASTGVISLYRYFEGSTTRLDNDIKIKIIGNIDSISPVLTLFKSDGSTERVDFSININIYGSKILTHTISSDVVSIVFTFWNGAWDSESILENIEIVGTHEGEERTIYSLQNRIEHLETERSDWANLEYGREIGYREAFFGAAFTPELTSAMVWGYDNSFKIKNGVSYMIYDRMAKQTSHTTYRFGFLMRYNPSKRNGYYIKQMTTTADSDGTINAVFELYKMTNNQSTLIGKWENITVEDGDVVGAYIREDSLKNDSPFYISINNTYYDTSHSSFTSYDDDELESPVYERGYWGFLLPEKSGSSVSFFSYGGVQTTDFVSEGETVIRGGHTPTNAFVVDNVPIYMKNVQLNINNSLIPQKIVQKGSEYFELINVKSEFSYGILFLTESERINVENLYLKYNKPMFIFKGRFIMLEKDMIVSEPKYVPSRARYYNHRIYRGKPVKEWVEKLPKQLTIGLILFEDDHAGYDAISELVDESSYGEPIVYSDARFYVRGYITNVAKKYISDRVVQYDITIEE